MTERRKPHIYNTLGRRQILWALCALLCWGLCAMAFPQASKQGKQKPRDPYSRPAPTVQIKPQMPSVNRYLPNRVFLEKADSLYRPSGSMEEMQIVSGSVVFRQGGTWLYCDSAYYYPEENSMDAFGHVKMTQGDTLFVYADKVYYDGMARYARLRCGPSQPKVKLHNRKVTLVTDSLDYDLRQELGWYDCGGRLEDDVNTLTSQQGRYSPATKDAEFFMDVVLVNRKDGYRLLSDTLYYNTASHVARIVSPTRILSENDTILTSLGSYNTTTGNADLESRSTIIHRDSAGNVTTLEGDIVVYDKATSITRAYAFSPESGRNARPMVLTDTARHMVLIGGYGEYNDANQSAMATGYPLLKEYSTPDTIFMRADTIRTGYVTSLVPNREKALADSAKAAQMPDSVDTRYRMARAYTRARFFKQDLQGVADSITFVELDSMLYLDRGPIVWSDERQVSGGRIEVHLNDSTADRAYLPDYGMMMEHVDEDFFNQLSGRKMLAFLENQTLRRLEVEGNVQTIFLPQEKDSTYNRLVTAESSNLTLDMKDGEIDRLKMWPEVTGNFTPIFLVKQGQKYLPGAAWRDVIRPKRVWLDTRWSWDDDLGELSPELEAYFESIAVPKATAETTPNPPRP